MFIDACIGIYLKRSVSFHFHSQHTSRVLNKNDITKIRCKFKLTFAYFLNDIRKKLKFNLSCTSVGCEPLKQRQIEIYILCNAVLLQYLRQMSDGVNGT